MNTASFNDQDVNISIKNFGVQICPYLFLFKLRDNNTIVFTDKQYCSKASIQIILNILVLLSSTIYFYVLCMISYFIIIIINNLIERECLVFNLSYRNWLFIFKRIVPKKTFLLFYNSFRGRNDENDLSWWYPSESFFFYSYETTVSTSLASTTTFMITMISEDIIFPKNTINKLLML